MRMDRERGLTYIELLVVVAVLAVLATAVLPLARWTEKRRLETRLRGNLQTMRDAIDTYKKYTEEGLITQTDVEQMGYPLKLEDLVEGVEVGDPESPEKKKLKLLARIPVDPMTNEPEWGFRSYQDDWDSKSWGGENVFDVYSLSDRMALDGTYYRDW
jgi:general secretion pathway protein G